MAKGIKKVTIGRGLSSLLTNFEDPEKVALKKTIEEQKIIISYLEGELKKALKEL